MKQKAILLSSGSQAAQVILQVIAGRRKGVRVCATNSVADGPGLRQFDKVFLVPTTFANREAYNARVAEIVETEQVDLAIPCRDADIVAFAEIVEQRPA